MATPVASSFAMEETALNKIIDLGRTIRLSHGKDDVDPFIASPSLVNIVAPLAEMVNYPFKSRIFPKIRKTIKNSYNIQKGEIGDVTKCILISVLLFSAKLFSETNVGLCKIKYMYFV